MGSEISRRHFLGMAAAGAAGAIIAEAGAKGIEAASSQPAAKQGAVTPTEGTRTTRVTTNPNSSVVIEKPETAIKYDVVDSHLHFLDFIQTTDGFPKLFEAMDTAGVSSTVLFGMAMAKQWDEDNSEPSYYLSNDSRCYYYSGTDFLLLEAYERLGADQKKRIHPFVCGVNPNDRFAVDHIKQLFELYPNTIAGIGELMSRHDDLTALTYGEPPHLDHPAFLEIFDFAAQQDVPVLVHHNVTAQSTEDVLYLDELDRAVSHNPNCKIIWAHIGISRRVEVPHLDQIADKLLTAHKNLWIDISWIVYDYYFQDKFPDGYQDGVTMDNWVALMEKWPDRFLLGTDKVGHWATYPAEIVKYYELLDKLKPETAKKICHDNILGLIKTYE